MIAMAACLCMTGCFKPVRYSTELDAREIEMHYGDLALNGDVRDRWWEAYGDTALNSFVETVLRENPSLQTAYLRLLDAEIAHRQAEAGYYPNLSFSAGVGYGGTISENSRSDPSYSLGLSLSYEVDLWGKVRAQRRVSELSMLSAQDSAESAALSLVGSVVTEWFTVLYYRERRELTAQLLSISESYYELVQSYYRNGQTNGMDVLEQRQQLETLRSTLSEIDSNIRISEHSLSILAGGEVMPSVEGRLPEAIDVGGTVDVSRLIESRPDIRSARRSAEKADAQVVIALADRLPSLRLSASLAFRSTSIVDLFKALLWDLGANFVANIFDGFNKTAAIDRAKISYLSERFSYANTVMKAAAEVEQALLKLRIREQALVDARAQLERQKEILEVSRQYFASGALDYNRVLSALRSFVSTSQSELEARRSLLNAQIDLFKSMGG
ncbi:MAG: efflux transporter outer membrane subunit, partial [Proteobacteria bacterium]|nr:efflux transporter outer membrane subunit [Pseudomonadota bacterium]